MQTWSVGAPGYYDPKTSKVVGKVDIALAPRGKGLPKIYGIGGWGMAINADAKDKQKEAAWTFIKWVTSPAIQKEMNLCRRRQLHPQEHGGRQGPERKISVPAGSQRSV